MTDTSKKPREKLDELIREFGRGNYHHVNDTSKRKTMSFEDCQATYKYLSAYQSLKEQCEKLEKTLEFYGDEDKYFMKEVTIKPEDCVFASKYNEEKGQCESVEIKEPFTSKIYECSARLKVDQGKQARQALAEFKKFKGEL